MQVVTGEGWGDQRFGSVDGGGDCGVNGHAQSNSGKRSLRHVICRWGRWGARVYLGDGVHNLGEASGRVWRECAGDCDV